MRTLLPHGWSSLSRPLRFAAAGGVAGLALLAAAPAYAAQGSIDHVENQPGALQVLYSLPGLSGNTQADLSTLKVTLDGKSVAATAKLATSAGQTVKRTTMLAFDVSNSMKHHNKFAEAKQAADVFLNAAPKDVYVGIVTFAGNVTVAEAPTLDRSASKKLVSGLSLSNGTRLYDGVSKAVSAAGGTGQRSVLVLSDGKDTTNTPISSVEKTIKSTGTKVDVVALDQSASDIARIKPLADAGNGQVFDAKNPSSLSGVFASEAATLAKQLLITVQPPASETGGHTLSVSVDAGGSSYTDSAFVTVGKAATVKPKGHAVDNTLLHSAPPPKTAVSRKLMLDGLAAVGVGLLVLVLALFWPNKKKQTLESKIEAYTRPTRARAAKPAHAQSGVGAQAVGVAEKALRRNTGFEQKLASRLDGANVSLKPAEWLLLHASAVLIGAAAGIMLIGGVIGFLIGLAAGLVLPWFYLGFRRARRLKAFGAQLAGTLQLMAGSLQAGLSFTQSIDTVVREGEDPIASEFRRALVETRLGVPMEDALDPISERMQSEDFGWTVMAVRIQREVGGNLAELLLQVAATLRERDYLRRQVKALSAEGRFSAYILLALPPAILLYMSVANRTYLHPLFSTGIGYVMLVIMAVLMVLGAVMMKKMIKLDV